jgi:hemerythrin
MLLIEWSEKLETGIGKIDEQHKKLVDRVNELNEAMRKGRGKEVVAPILDELKRYTDYHFGTEERAFEEYRYPQREAHKRQHADLVAKLDDLIAKNKSNTFMISVDVLDFLKAWLSNHILKEDMEYVPHLKGKEIKG